MSDPRPFPRLRLGEVPVLALLAAAAMAGYVVAGGTDRAPAPAPTTPRTVVAPVEEPPRPAPAEESAPPAIAEPAPEPPSPTAPEAEVAAAPEAPPPVAAESPLDGVRAALAGIRCADLRVDLVEGVVTVAGTVTNPDDEGRVQRIIEALPPGAARPPSLAVASPALCEPLLLLEPWRDANAARGRPLSVTAAAGDGVFTGGQDFVLELRDANGAAAVQVDYVTVDGSVVHLLPNPSEPAAALEPGVARRLGERSGRTRFWTIGPPFGQELIIVLSSASPLFPTPRPETEPAAAYLPDLKRALAGPGTENALAAVLFITTQAP